MVRINHGKVMKDFFKFQSAGPTAAHSVLKATVLLKKAGFEPLLEGSKWNLKAGDKRYVTRGGTSLVAFVIGSKPPQNSGFKIVGAHTDSPCLRLKPNAPYQSQEYGMLGVEVYGGPILATWADRDLSIAGKIAIRTKGKTEYRLVDLKHPVCRVPTLAIHLDREVNKKGLLFDMQKHLPPVCNLEGQKFSSKNFNVLLAKAAKVKPKDILDYSLDLYDTQKPVLGGFNEEFYFSGKIDNLAGCFCALEAIIKAKSHSSTSVIALFDHEEVGSSSYVGAASTFLDVVLERICLKGARSTENFYRAISKSILVSSDGAHAVHPNFSSMHDKHHKPMLNNGPVIKVNAKQKYATNTETKTYFLECANKSKAPCQVIVNRADLLSGSTIGPISSTRLGIATVDVGVPMISMHSIREMGGVKDMGYMTSALIAHFNLL